MIHKIHSSELQPGMYVTDMGLSPTEYPNVFPGSVLLKSRAEIDAIVARGYTEAFVDETKSSVPVSAQTAWADLIQSSIKPALSAVLPDAKTVQARVEKAVTMYASAMETANTLFSSLEKGKNLPMDSVYNVATSVVDSILSDDMTLATVSKLQAHDNYTFSHSVNVSVLATLFGRHLDMEQEDLHMLAIAGLLHDIGKIIIPHKLLNTARRLQDSEFEIMKQHSLAGYKKLKSAEGIPKNVKLAVLEHHERYNGTGYPYGRQGDEISLMGRILSLVDVYDALTSKRAYKPALLPYTAVSFLYAQRGQHFAPDLVDRFIQCVGVYPVGSVVVLSSDETAVVFRSNPTKPLLPVVAVVTDASGAKRPLRMVDLAASDSLKVKACLDPLQAGIQCSTVLKACTWAQNTAAMAGAASAPAAKSFAAARGGR